MKQADKERAVVTVAVSVPQSLLRQLHEAAADRMRAGLSGGMSGTVRELLAAGLATRRRKVQPEPRV